MANIREKRTSTASAARKMQTRTAVRYQHTPIRKVKAKNKTPNAGEDVEKLNCWCVAGGYVK